MNEDCINTEQLFKSLRQIQSQDVKLNNYERVGKGNKYSTQKERLMAMDINILKNENDNLRRIIRGLMLVYGLSTKNNS